MNSNDTIKQLKDLYPTASEGFISILVCALEIHAKKRNDYNGVGFVQEYSEFMTTGKFWDIKRKYDRLYNKMVKGMNYMVDESLEDTLLDLGNYAFLMAEYLRDMKKSV